MSTATGRNFQWYWAPCWA